MHFIDIFFTKRLNRPDGAEISCLHWIHDNKEPGNKRKAQVIAFRVDKTWQALQEEACFAVKHVAWEVNNGDKSR